MSELLVSKGTERSSRAGKQDLLYFVAVLSHKALEYSRVFRVDGKDWRVVFACKPADELSRHDKCLLVCQANLLMCLDGMYRRRKTGEADHCRQDHIYRSRLNDFVQSLRSGIDLYVRFITERVRKFLVVLLISYHDSGRMELPCLFGKQLPVVVCRQGISLIEVRMLRYDVKPLCTYAPGRA